MKRTSDEEVMVIRSWHCRARSLDEVSSCSSAHTAHAEELMQLMQKSSCRGAHAAHAAELMQLMQGSSCSSCGRAHAAHAKELMQERSVRLDELVHSSSSQTLLSKKGHNFGCRGPIWVIRKPTSSLLMGLQFLSRMLVQILTFP